jgi:hypothetical protein
LNRSKDEGHSIGDMRGETDGSRSSYEDLEIATESVIQPKVMLDGRKVGLESLIGIHQSVVTRYEIIRIFRCRGLANPRGRLSYTRPRDNQGQDGKENHNSDDTPTPNGLRIYQLSSISSPVTARRLGHIPREDNRTLDKLRTWKLKVRKDPATDFAQGDELCPTTDNFTEPQPTKLKCEP